MQEISVKCLLAVARPASVAASTCMQHTAEAVTAQAYMHADAVGSDRPPL